MSLFRYMVAITCDTEEQAVKVMNERLSHDEDYGFDYRIDWKPATATYASFAQEAEDALLFGHDLAYPLPVDLPCCGYSSSSPQETLEHERSCPYADEID